MHAAVDAKNLEALSILIDKEIAQPNLNVADEYNMTPLHIASINFNRKIFDVLIGLKPNVHLKDNDGLTATDYINDNEEIEDNIKQELISKYFN